MYKMKKFVPFIALSSLFFGTVTVTIASASDLPIKTSRVIVAQNSQQQTSEDSKAEVA